MAEQETIPSEKTVEVPILVDQKNNEVAIFRKESSEELIEDLSSGSLEESSCSESEFDDIVKLFDDCGSRDELKEEANRGPAALPLTKRRKREIQKRRKVEHLTALEISFDLESNLNRHGYAEIDYRELYMDKINEIDPTFISKYPNRLKLIDPVLDTNENNNKFNYSDQEDIENSDMEFDLNDSMIDNEEYEEIRIADNYDTEKGGIYINYGPASLKKINLSKETASGTSKKKKESKSLPTDKPKKLKNVKPKSNQQKSEPEIKITNKKNVTVDPKTSKTSNVDPLAEVPPKVAKIDDKVNQVSISNNPIKPTKIDLENKSSNENTSKNSSVVVKRIQPVKVVKIAEPKPPVLNEANRSSEKKLVSPPSESLTSQHTPFVVREPKTLVESSEMEESFKVDNYLNDMIPEKDIITIPYSPKRTHEEKNHHSSIRNRFELPSDK